MQNVEITVSEDDVLTIKVNLREVVGFTKSNRNALIGSTGGNLPVWTAEGPHPSGARLNCSVFRPLLSKEKRALEKARTPFGSLFT